MSRHYLDHASTSPLRPEVSAAIRRCLDPTPGDPGRMYSEALQARAAVEAAREEVANLFGARSHEVVFTSGATESIATVCRGVTARGSHQVLSAIEHSAVRAACIVGPFTVVGVDETGRIDPDEIGSTITDETAVVHVQAGNHEVGTTQDLEAVASVCRDRGVLLHVDAAQAAGRVALDFEATGIDLMSLSAHKLGGPQGVGALLVRRGLRLNPLLTGGDQERARRAGMENVIGAIGFGAAAAALGSGTLSEEADRARTRIASILDACSAIDGVEVFGHPHHRLPHIACVGISDVEPQAVLLGLDRRGIAVHSGSACSSESLEPSPVLAAMGADAHRSLRISVGWCSTDADVAAVIESLPIVLADLRSLRSGSPDHPATR